MLLFKSRFVGIIYAYRNFLFPFGLKWLESHGIYFMTFFMPTPYTKPQKQIKPERILQTGFKSSLLHYLGRYPRLNRIL